MKGESNELSFTVKTKRAEMCCEPRVEYNAEEKTAAQKRCLPPNHQQSNGSQKKIMLRCWTDIKGRGLKQFLCHTEWPSSTSLPPYVHRQVDIHYKPNAHKHKHCALFSLCSNLHHLTHLLTCFLWHFPSSGTVTVSQLGIRHSCLDLWTLKSLKAGRHPAW